MGVTPHFIDGDWKLKSFALGAMKTETRHFADKVAEQFLKVANDWGIANKMTTIDTDSTANMKAAMRALPYEHIACNAHILQRTITVCLDDNGVVSVLASPVRSLAISNTALPVPQSSTSSKQHLVKRKNN